MVKMPKDIMALADFGEGGSLSAFPEPWERLLQSLQNRERVGIGLVVLPEGEGYNSSNFPLSKSKLNALRLCGMVHHRRHAYKRSGLLRRKTSR